MKTQKRVKRNVPEFEPPKVKVIESAKISSKKISENDLITLKIISQMYFKKYHNNYIYEINFPINCSIYQIKCSSFKFLHLYSIVFPPSLSILLPEALKGCRYLKQIKFIKNESNQNILDYICDKAFRDTKISTIVIPDSVKEIGSLCFPKCISKIVLENGLPKLRKIGDAAFSETQITSFYMPINIIPFVNAKNVFFKCKNLNELIFDNFSKSKENFIDEKQEEEKRKNRKTKFLNDIQKKSNENELIRTQLTQDFAKSLLLSQINIEKLKVLYSNLNYFYFYNTPNLNSIVIPQNNDANFIIHQGCIYTEDKKKLIVAKRNITDSIICANCKIISNYAFNVKCLQNVSFENKSELKEISFLAFYDSQIKNINLPNGVDFIDYGAFYKCKQLESINIPKSMYLIDYFTFSYTNITKIVIPKKIRKIEFGSFLGCFNLANVEFEKESKLNEIDDYAFAYTKINSISIPKNVKRLGNFCFYDCRELTFIDFEDYSNITNIGSYCFNNTQIDESKIHQILKTIDYSCVNENKKISIMKPNFCENITQISIPSHVDEIGFHAFFDCQTLQKVEIIDSENSKLTKIADGAFFNCSSLTEFNIPKSVDYFGNDSFMNCTKYKVSIKVENEKKIFIGERAFENSGVITFKISCDYLQINNQAFQNCSNLTKISLDVLKKCIIGNSTFENCKVLQKVKINENVQNIQIGENCFMNSSITKFKVPLNLNSIQTSCFKLCKKLKKVVINENSNINNFGLEAFYESGIQQIFIPCNTKFIGKSCFENCKKLTYLDFSTSLNDCIIEENAFSMTGIIEITIPNGIKQIKYGCFEDCSHLKVVNFSDFGINLIDDNVFKSTKIKNLIIPSSIKIIGKSSFQNCSKLETVQFLGNDITISPSSFYECYQIQSFKFNSYIKINDYMFSNYVYYLKYDEINIIKDFLVKNNQIIKFHQETISFSHLLIDEKSCVTPKMILYQEKDNIPMKKLKRELKFIKYFNGGYYSSNFDEIYFSDSTIESITIPKNTKVISQDTFRYSSLTNIDFEKCSILETIGISAFQGILINEITIPDSVLLIDNYAFSNCKLLKKVNIGLNSKLKQIGIGAFKSTAIETIVLPSTLEIIDDFAFFKCQQLITVDNHSNQIIFGYKSFYYSSIENIKFPSIAAFSISSFQGCTNLRQFSFLENPKKIIFDVDSFASSGIESISLNCIVHIYENTFSFCPNLEKIDLEGNDIKCAYNSFDSPNITKCILDLNVEINEKKCDPKKHFLFIKDRVMLSKIEKLILNLSFQNYDDPNVYKQNFYYNHNCFVVDDELYYANKIDNFNLFKSNIIESNDDNISGNSENNNNEIKKKKIKKNEILQISQNVKKLNFQTLPHIKKIQFHPNSNIDDLGPPGFFSYSYLVEIEIPKFVKVIPPRLFQNCHYLENVNFTKGSLLNEIGEFSFSDTKVNKVILPDSVAIIKQYAFSFNKHLKTVVFNGEIIENDAFLNSGITSFSLSNNTKFIGSNAFQYCKCLSQFDIDINNSNLSEIGEYAFSDTSLIEFNIPSSIKTIKRFTFNGCSYLKKISISDNSNLENIEEYSFAGDLSLELINIPKSIINISPSAFINTPSLISIMIESNDKYYVMNDNELYLKNDINFELIFVPRYLKQFKIIQNCSKINCGSFCGPNIEEIIFPDLSLKCIGNCAFAHSTGLKKITLPQSLLTIEDEAFIDCQNLEIVEFDQSSQLKEIPKYCFAFSGLVSINLPNSIEVINDSSFYFCIYLKYINITNTNVKYIGDSAFSGTNIEEIKFPSTIKYISYHSFENTKSLKLIDFTNCHKIKDYQKITKKAKSAHSFISKIKRIKPLPKQFTKEKTKLFISNLVSILKNDNQSSCTPIIIKPNQSNPIPLMKSASTQTGSNLTIIKSPVVQLPPIELNNEKETKTICYIHESSFKNSFVKTVILNLNKFKWLNFIDKCSKVEEYIVNPNIHLYMRKQTNERKLFNNETDHLLGNLYRVSGLKWENNVLLEYSKKNPIWLNPFHFFTSVRLTKISLTNDLKIKSIPKCIFSFTHIKEITIPSTVKEIKTSAFMHCCELETVTFLTNSQLKKIGNFAFYGCYNLKTISMSDNIKSIPFKCFAFSGLTEFVFPKQIEKVDKMAFFNCTNLQKIVFNEGLHELDNSSFANNISLQNIDFPNSLEKINTRVFSGCINLKHVNTTPNSNLVEIGNFSFENTQIEELKLNPKIKKLFEPKDVSKLNKISFYNGEITNFKQFEDGTIYEFYDNLFQPIKEDKNSEEEDSSDDINKQKNKFFNYIMSQPKNYRLVFAPKNLKHLKIRECCASIGNYVLNGMKNLTTIEYANGESTIISNFPNHYNIDDNIKHIQIFGKYSYFENCKFSYFHSLEIVDFGEMANLFIIPKFAFENCSNLKEVTVPHSCTIIEEGSFKNCIKLSSFKFKQEHQNKKEDYFHECTLQIGKESFYNCSSLTEIIIPSYISSVDDKAFMNCTKLKHFEMENSLTLKYIGKSSFKNCYSLEKISFSTLFHFKIGNSAFMNCKKLKIVSIKGNDLYGFDFRTFYNCSSLVRFEFTYQEGLDFEYLDYVFLGFESFMNCSSLKQFILDFSSAKNNDDEIENREKMKLKFRKQEIQKKAFYNCKSLEKVQLLNGNIQKIHENAFTNCSSLQTLEIKSNQNLFLPKNLNNAAFINAPGNLVIKLINNEEIGSFNIANIKKHHKTGIKTFKEYSSNLENDLYFHNIDDNLKSKDKKYFSKNELCNFFIPMKRYFVCNCFYTIQSIFNTTVPIKIRNKHTKSIFDDKNDYKTEYYYIPVSKPPLNI